jgi:hypothetical protein
LLYAGAIAYFWRGDIPSSARFDTPFDTLHHPVVTIGTGLFSLLCLGSAVWNHFQRREETAWQVTRGWIVSGDVDADLTPKPRSPRDPKDGLIEFSYKVDGHEYHATSSPDDRPAATKRAGKKYAIDLGAAQSAYADGSEIEVFYDPKNPIDGVLEKPEPQKLDGRHSLVVGFVFLLIALYSYYH